MKSVLHSVVPFILLLAASAAPAQYVPMDFTSQTFNSMNLSSSYVLNQSMLENAKSARQSESVGASTITTGHSDAARDLAAHFPESHRGAAHTTFKQLLAGFAAIETSLGTAHGDTAVAMACLIIGSYEAYHDRTLDPVTYQPVIRQLQAAIASDAAYAALPAQKRRALYEHAAILGMYVTSARAAQARQLASAADRARLRAAAEGYLRSLQLAPERLSIDARGVTLESAR